MKRVLFVSSVNLSTNPRILKEIKLALSLGFKPTFVGFNLGNWSDEKDKGILESLPGLNYIYLDATRKYFLRWLLDSFLQRFFVKLWPYFQHNLYVSSGAHNKRTFALLRLFKKIRKEKYDFVIAHTLSALYPAMIIAGDMSCPFAFDIEDYHPGEFCEIDAANELKRRELLMKDLLQKCAYVTAASNLIATQTETLIGKKLAVIHPVLNFFSKNEFSQPEPIVEGSYKIRLCWFSQCIAFGRGLELILKHWGHLKKDFDLTLIGQPDPAFSKEIPTDIQVQDPLSQVELHNYLKKFDIGLALDLGSTDGNRDIALTNKILAYYQAGLYIVATDTSAQQNFLNNHPGHGEAIKQDGTDIPQVFLEIKENIEEIRKSAINRYRSASYQSWEKESGILKDLWTKHILQ